MYRASSGSYKLNNSPHLSLSSLESGRVDYYRTTVWQGPHNRTKQGALKGAEKGALSRDVGKLPGKLGSQLNQAEKVVSLWLPPPEGQAGYQNELPTFLASVFIKGRRNTQHKATNFILLTEDIKKKPKTTTSHYFISKAF